MQETFYYFLQCSGWGSNYTTTPLQKAPQLFSSNLLNLLNEEVGELQVHLHARLLDSVIQYVVVRVRQLDARKQVRGDAMKQRQVVVEEFRQVDVEDGPQHQDVFIFIRVFQLKTNYTLHNVMSDSTSRTTVNNDNFYFL